VFDPSIPSARFVAPQAKWRMVDSLYGGTETMRQAGTLYLPRNEREIEPDWIARLHRTTLFNAYRRSLQHAVARIFQEDIVLEGYSGELTIFSADVDAQGADLTQFAKQRCIDGMNRGVSYFLIEFPKRDVQPLTLADAIASGDRPYWVPIQATQVLAAHSKLLNGKEKLTHFRFTEIVVEVSDDGLTEKSVEQVKAFNRMATTDGSVVTFTVWRKVDGTWIERADLSGELVGVPEIPVVSYYTNRSGFFIGTPPMMDLAETNVAHWQSASEQRNILHVARVPFLHMAGFDQAADPETGQKKEQEISIRSVAIGAHDSKVGWVDTNGNALKAGSDDLADLEAKMEKLGMSLSAPKSGTTTATENSINAVEANSLLKDMALALGDTLEQALYFTSLYLGIPPAERGKVVVSTKFAVDLVPESASTPSKSINS
jgi:hypothetical protein